MTVQPSSHRILSDVTCPGLQCKVHGCSQLAVLVVKLHPDWVFVCNLHAPLGPSVVGNIMLAVGDKADLTVLYLRPVAPKPTTRHW